MPRSLLVLYGLDACAIALACAAVPLARRGARAAAWRAHAVGALLLGAALSGVVYAMLDDLLPWWHVGAAYGPALAGPVLAAGWAARRAAAAWPSAGWARVSGAVLAAYTLTAAAGGCALAWLVPNALRVAQ